MITHPKLFVSPRGAWLCNPHKLGVQVITHVGLFGIDAGDAYFQHKLSDELVALETVDTLVTANGHTRNRELEGAFKRLAIPRHVIKDTWSPQTAEEAMLEGLIVGVAV